MHERATMTVRLVRGRSKQSTLLVALRHLHVFVWAPAMGADSYGTTVRFRRANDWHHLRIVLWQRNRVGWKPDRPGHFFVRPTVTALELSRWRTRTGTTERWGLKNYVRVKLSAGGRQVA
jgi:hypothetical protein